jgi:hypothetical protein
MITPQEIESFARQIADPDFAISHISRDSLIGHLSDMDQADVLTRVAEIACENAAAAQADADIAVALMRLALAAGCPDGIPAIPWLMERGLVKEVDGVLRFKPAKPGGHDAVNRERAKPQ